MHVSCSKTRPPTPPPPIEVADMETQTEGEVVEQVQVVECCEATFSICGQALRVLVSKGGNVGAEEASAVVDRFEHLKRQGGWAEGGAVQYVQEALRALLRQIERLQVTVVSKKETIRQSLQEATEMFDASEEGQQLQEDKVTQGLKTLAGFVRKRSQLIKHPTPAFVMRMEEMTRRAAERWNRRKTEILRQRAAGILSCMTAMHGLGSDGQEAFFRTLARHRDGSQYSFWALQSDGVSQIFPSEHVRPPGFSGHFSSSRTRPLGYTGRYLSRVDLVRTENGEYARVRTAPNSSEHISPRPWSASNEGAHGGGQGQLQGSGGAAAHELHAGEGSSRSHDAHPRAVSVGIRPLAINSWSQSVERGFRRLPPSALEASPADNAGMRDGASTERQDAPRDKAQWDLPSPPKQPKTARAHPTSPRWQTGSAAAQERLHTLMRGRTSGAGPAFSAFDPDVSSPGNVLKTQRWLGELSPKTSFFRTGPSALQPLDGVRRSEGRGGPSARRAAGDGDGMSKEAGTSSAWLAPSGKSVTYSLRETS